MNTLATKSKKLVPLAYSLLSAGDAAEVSDDYELLDINEMITKGREGFIAYPITGDSMIAGIQPGSVVFVDPYCEPKNGDIVACCVNGRNNVKIFKRTSTHLYLVSANKKYSPKEVTARDSFHVLGVVRGNLTLY